MPAKTIFMFSGQGSQYYQMGMQLYQQDAVFRHWMNRLDALARDLSGRQVVATIYGSPKTDVFGRLALTHPAIFMVEVALARCLIAQGVEPDLTLGASLGSFAAAVIGGHMTMEDALAAVLHQAETVERLCEPGGMIAIMADPALHAEAFLHERSDLAALNFGTHFAVSARQADLAPIEAWLRQRELVHQRLPVGFAFHSRWIEAARQPVAAFMRSRPMSRGGLPLVCCEGARTLAALPGDHVWQMVRNPIRFHDTVAHLERSGPHRYIDVGPSGTLATFVKYGLPKASQSSTHAILTPFGQDIRNLDALLAAA